LFVEEAAFATTDWADYPVQGVPLRNALGRFAARISTTDTDTGEVYMRRL